MPISSYLLLRLGFPLDAFTIIALPINYDGRKKVIKIHFGNEKRIKGLSFGE